MNNMENRKQDELRQLATTTFSGRPLGKTPCARAYKAAGCIGVDVFIE